MNKRILTSALAMSMATSLFAGAFSPVFAAKVTDGKGSKTPNTVVVKGDPAVEYISGLVASENIYIDDDTNRVAYCLNSNKKTPKGHVFEEGEKIIDPVILAALYHGFPSNASGLQEKHGLTNSEARYYTQVVIWNRIGTEPGASIEDSVPYYNELLALSRAKDVGPKREVNASRRTSQLFLSDAGVQETESIRITGTTAGQFTFPSTDEFWSVDESGNKKDTFNIGDHFKIQTSPSFTGTKRFSISAFLYEMGSQKWNSPDPQVQHVVEPLPHTPVPFNLDIEITSDVGAIALSKKTDDGANLEGVVFGLYDDESATREIDRATTDNKGRLKFESLSLSRDYFIKELSAPAGYIVDESIHRVTMNSNLEMIQVVNERIQGYITIHKVDSADNATAIPNTEFEIRDKDNNFIEKLVTDSNGLAKSSLLPYGDYIVVETKSADGYILDSTPKSITINSPMQEHVVFVSNDLMYGEIVINKVDEETKEPLAGVMFDIYTKSNTYVKSVMTDDNGIAKSGSMPYGEYYFKESEALEGYKKIDDTFDVSISEDGKTYEFTVANRKIKGAVDFTKTDVATGEVIEGAHIKITGLSEHNKDFVLEFESSKEGNRFELDYGKYQIEETIAPEGYVLTTETGEFEITEDGSVVKANIKNKRIQGTVDFTKTDVATGEVIEGAHIKITGLSEHNKDFALEFESSKEGNRFELDYGKYQIEETIAPEGYVLTTETGEFEITEDGVVIKTNIKNQRIQGSLKITKVSAVDENIVLEGAVFGIYNEDKELVEEVTTDENGVAVIENLTYGTYFYKELSAPKGYVVDDTMNVFVIDTHEEVIEVTVTNTPEEKPVTPKPEVKPEVKPETLPETGGYSTVMNLLGATSIGLGAYMTLKRKRK